MIPRACESTCRKHRTSGAGTPEKNAGPGRPPPVRVRHINARCQEKSNEIKRGMALQQALATVVYRSIRNSGLLADSTVA